MRVRRHTLRRRRRRREALGRDVRRRGDDLLLVEVAKDVGNHRRHLLARLDLLDRAVLVNTAARDALQKLVKVERGVLDAAARLLLRVDKGGLRLRHRQAALELGADAIVANNVGALSAG